MADPILEFDPSAESSGSPLTITTGNYALSALDSPAPPEKYQWASSIDTEGSVRASAGHENRTVTITLEVVGATALADLAGKIGKLHREGGTLKYTSPASTVRTFDILATQGYTPTYDHMHFLGGVTTVQFSLPAKPYLRGTESDLGDNVETTLPALIFTEASVPGDVPALGRLVIDDDSAANQWWLTWGIQSRYYSSSANAALFYEAEGRTLMGGSVLAGGVGFVSGGGSNIVSNTSLTTSYKAIMSTQATGGGAHLSHVGTFRVYARVTNISVAADVSIALEWGAADFLHYTRNQAVTVPPMEANSWKLVDLGLVILDPVVAGTQRWEGRIVAMATVASNEFAIDCLFLVPVDEGSGIVSGVERGYTPTSYSAEDHFTSTTAGNALNARVAPTGGTWATSGDATDLAFGDSATYVGSEGVGRSVTSATNGRYAILGSTNYTSVAVQVSIGRDGFPNTTGHELRLGAIARWTDSSNYLRAYVKDPYAGDADDTLMIERIVSGIAKTIASIDLGTNLSIWSINEVQPLRLTVTTSGIATVDLFNADGTNVVASCSGYSSTLQTGGTLATGKPGFWDYSSGSTHGRYYDEFYVWVPPTDAAIFASQSLELRSDSVNREDSGGTLWTRPSDYRGDYLLVPASGAEGRTTRVIIKASRNDPAVANYNIDDISARLFVTPRYLTLPA